MFSLKAYAACAGCPPTFGVLRDFFGYASAPPWNLAPAGQQSSLPQVLSVGTQIARLRDTHFDLDVIRVGTDAAGLMSDTDEQNIDCAVEIARQIYAAAGIGIGRLDRWWQIPLSDHTGFDVIEDDGEAADLIDQYSAPTVGIDAFVVQAWEGNDVVGTTPSRGDGIALESRETDFLGTARTLAHELGHFFGLGHENDSPNNLMHQSAGANPWPGSTQLNADQAAEIRSNDAMTQPCRPVPPTTR